LYRKHFFLKKQKKAAGKCAHGKIFFDIKKRPLREDAHTAKEFLKIFNDFE